MRPWYEGKGQFLSVEVNGWSLVSMKTLEVPKGIVRFFTREYEPVTT